MITFITVNKQFSHTNNSEFHQWCLFTYCLLCRTRHQTQHFSLCNFVKDLSYVSEAHHYGCTLANETLAFAYLHSYHPNAHIMVDIATSDFCIDAENKMRFICFQRIHFTHWPIHVACVEWDFTKDITPIMSIK